MASVNNFTEGKIAGPLVRFALPMLLAFCLQSLYSAVDLLVVGQFGTPADVSAVSTGGQMMQMVLVVVTGLSMGATILLGQAIGAGKGQESGSLVGTSIVFFTGLALILTAVMLLVTVPFARLMQTPKEAFDKTLVYVRICSLGTIFITGYNVIGSIFRGIGDSRTPLITVAIACVVNIIGDLVLVAVFHMAAAGAAIATIAAQAVSVVLSLLLVRRQGLPFPFERSDIHLEKRHVLGIVKLGMPIALQDGLVSISFLVIAAIVNSLGVMISAGVGVAERVCGFIMLVPSAFSQALSTFVAQNTGAKKPERAVRGTIIAMGISFVIDAVIAYFSFFHGDLLAGIFTSDKQLITYAWEYLKSYSIDTLLVSFLFCFIGYFTGVGRTTFCMIQGLIGAFLVRVPVSWLMSRRVPVSLFHIGLATPCSTFVQILLCVGFLLVVRRKMNIKKPL